VEIIRERFGIDLRQVAGAKMSGEIPLSNDFVNRLVAERLGERAALRSARVEARDGDTLVAELVPRARLLPVLRIAARIEQQPDFPREGTLVLRWSMPSIGPLALFAAPVLAFFRALPPSISANGDRIAVDIRELLTSHGVGDAVPYIKALQIHTRADGFVVKFELSVPG
jgi:hypothetical protein